MNINDEELRRIPESINFPAEEEVTLKYWKDNKIFEQCLKNSKDLPRYTFYDGPPFATGLPHYGHILAGTIKDVVTRYAHQLGYHVDRRFGWDCHGLPVEYEIDKMLNIRGPDDVLKMGIAAYNAECRKIVMRYADDWEKIIQRVGRWIDFKNDYKTLYPSYMESIWWVFQQIFEKGLVYEGVKVMPYSTACTTAISNFESGQNFKDVVDPCVVVTFPLISENASVLAWTTTPWTLPSNLALCVHPELVYVRVRENATGKIFILMESRLEYVFKNSVETVTVIETFPGKNLENLSYEPLFPYYVEFGRTTNAFRILCDTYVTEDAGTGVVHQAPYFGEDDFRICLTNGIIKRDQETICPVDASGRFTEPVVDFLGEYVKDADKNIIANLKSRSRLLSAGQLQHSYPFCWRSDTPLIYKAVPSWFIRVEHMSKQLLDCSAQTYWVPEFVKEKRFGNWLRDARDWAVSRNRYWGTPIPIWCSVDRKEIICVGSIQELAELSGVRVTDLHRESIDNITIPSKRPNEPPLRRISEVFDCWFESGSMPFAQSHYPFENANLFENNFPADFIAEGIDQTRGWFYTLLVISTALFNKPPFKNLIVNGLVLASDGQKMSKRKKNYPDPMEVVNKYGADALRLYLINSPVVRADNLRFKEDGVKDVIKDVFLPWYNAFRFCLQNIDRLEQETNFKYKYNANKVHVSSNVMDQWILSLKESLLKFVADEMKAYRLYTVVPRLTKFIDHLTNWYVRMNRSRFKCSDPTQMDDCHTALNTLFDILLAMIKMMAPFTPFLTEYMYQRMSKFELTDSKAAFSVHALMMPTSNPERILLPIESSVQRMQSIIELGRIVRDRQTIPIKYPLREIVIIHRNAECLNEIRSLEFYIKSELNVRTMTLSSDRARYDVKLRAEPNFKQLGARFKEELKKMTSTITKLTDQEIENVMDLKKSFNINGHELCFDDVRIIYYLADGKSKDSKYAADSDNDVLILLDTTASDELLHEGFAREIINRIQKMKKKAKLVPTDSVRVLYKITTDTIGLQHVAEQYRKLIEQTVKSPWINVSGDTPTVSDADAKIVNLLDEEHTIKGAIIKIWLFGEQKLNTSDNKHNNQFVNESVPFVMLNLDKTLEPRYGNNTSAKPLRLKTEKNRFITAVELSNEIDIMFGLQGRRYNLKLDGNQNMDWANHPEMLAGKMLYITK